MVYIFDRLDQYTDEAYEKHLSSLPAWRREKALQYKKLDDRKRSVLAFVLLQRALREEYGITEIPEFVYNEFGKPSLPNLPIHFSLSHCCHKLISCPSLTLCRKTFSKINFRLTIIKIHKTSNYFNNCQGFIF